MTAWADGASTNDPYIDATRVEIVDNQTMEIDFPNPTIALPQMTLTVNLDSRGLYSEKEIKEVGWEEWLTDPILSGPYKKLKDVPGERKEFEVHVDWWKKPAPDFEKHIHTTVPEAATRLALLASKQADVVTLSALSLNQALSLDHVNILQQPATVHLQFYFYNMLHQDDQGYDTDNPFMDARVREAFAIAIDRQALGGHCLRREIGGSERAHDGDRHEGLRPPARGRDEEQLDPIRSRKGQAATRRGGVPQGQNGEDSRRGVGAQRRA